MHFRLCDSLLPEHLLVELASVKLTARDMPALYRQMQRRALVACYQAYSIGLHVPIPKQSGAYDFPRSDLALHSILHALH
jgi:hypothetical protein